jgi:hypothetical protein
MSKSIIEQLYTTVEAQLHAARKLDVVALNQLTQERMELQSQVSLHTLVGMSQQERSQARERLLQIKLIDQRIRSCAQLVVDALANVMPGAAPVVYNARGYLRS